MCGFAHMWPNAAQLYDKGKGQDTCKRWLHKSVLWPAALYNLGSGSWLAWANSAAAHYVGHPLTALMDNWTHGAASRHTIAPISHTMPSPHSPQQVSYYSFPILLRVGGWVDLSTQQVSNLFKVACSGPGVSRTRKLSVTSPILYH